ncbi:MAG: protein-methionine-sulfoxide reductase catalytic subunit MsrP, partial [Pseudomonadota bacterium]
MLIKRPRDIRSSDITSESVYLNRRALLRAAGLSVGGLAAAACGAADSAPAKTAAASDGAPSKAGTGKFAKLVKSPFSTDEPLNSFDDITTYNNYYEFGTGKADPARNARDFQPLPWSVRVSGECEKPGTYTYEDIVGPHAFEERIYRLRCVEAWSMVVPWVGIPMGELLKRFAPTSRARYVVFQTLLDSDRMPGQRRPVLNWPYTEGLTIAEAMNPLTLMATGIYGQPLLPQNGAPL